MFNRFLLYVIYTNVWISCGAWSMYVSTCYFLNIPIDFFYACFVVLGTFITYNAYYLITDKKDAERSMFICKYRLWLLGLLFFSVLLFVFLTYSFCINHLIMLVLLGGSVLLYAISLEFVQRFKTFYLAMVWILVVVIVPAYLEGPITLTQDLFFMLHQFVYLLFLCFLFDQRDHVKQPKNVLKCFFGRYQNYLLVVFILLQGILCLIMNAYTLLLTDLILAVLALWTKANRGDLWYCGLLDGTLFLPFFLVLIER